ncbi:MAG: hypothetical protein O2U62_01210 [Candidatus Bathyarchaeota archaeon]|jgi:hypothetical protein|nr:hypothetical protein [Candidatus Bathyarchaeota archaeon]
MREYTLRFTVALGGFLIFMGIIMLGVVAMVFFGFVDVSTLENQEYRMLSLWVLFVVGALDLVSGIILRRK